MPGQIKEPFIKQCRWCKVEWSDWREFVLDPCLTLLGLQAITNIPDFNLFMFEHRCGSTISIRANLLRQHFPEGAEETGLPLLFGKDNCEGHCRSLEDLKGCQQACVNSRDRRLLLRLIEMKIEVASARSLPSH